VSFDKFMDKFVSLVSLATPVLGDLVAFFIGFLLCLTVKEEDMPEDC